MNDLVKGYDFLIDLMQHKLIRFGHIRVFNKYDREDGPTVLRLDGCWNLSKRKIELLKRINKIEGCND